MKRILSLLIITGVCMSLTACGVAAAVATAYLLGQGDGNEVMLEEDVGVGGSDKLWVNDSERFGNYGDPDSDTERTGGMELDGYYNSVSTEGQYKLQVPGRSVVAEGVPGAPFSFYFPTETGGYYDSFIGAIVLPVTDEVAALEARMPDLGGEFEDYAQRLFGDVLQEFTYETLREDGYSIYQSYLVLQDDRGRLAVTSCYRFEKSYYELVFGIDYGDLEPIHAMTLDAARNFVDYTDSPLSAMPSLFFSIDYTVNPPQWDYPITNGFASIKEHTVRVFRDGASPERQATDYEVIWQTDYMEEFARAITGVATGPVMSSDLDLITELRIDGGNAGRSIYDFSDGYNSIRMETDAPITSFADFEHFSRLVHLNIDVSTITDVSALSSMPQVEEMYLFLSEDITDLSPIGDVSELRQLMMWGRDYAKIEDASFFKGLDKMENIFFFASGVKDISPFFALPKLTTLGLIVDKSADTSLCYEHADRFETLVVNAEDYARITDREEW